MTVFCDAADKHKHLSSEGLKGVIAGGVIGIIAMLALLLLLRDLWGARRNRVSIRQHALHIVLVTGVWSPGFGH